MGNDPLFIGKQARLGKHTQICKHEKSLFLDICIYIMLHLWGPPVDRKERRRR